MALLRRGCLLLTLAVVLGAIACRGVVPRYTAVRLEAFDRDGDSIDLVAKDFFARVIQHETDHLDGIVYVDRMRDLSTLSHIAEWQKHWLGIAEQND